MAPLATRIRPQTLEDIIGQDHLIGKDKILTQMVTADLIQSMILFGPPGTGKTSIATALANTLNIPFRKLNAATDSKKDLQQVANEAKLHERFILILDEIHRLDKAKQDFLLPLLENGTITLIGATTENPYFAINSAILSRVQLFEVKPLKTSAIVKILKKALTSTHGLANFAIKYNDETLTYLAESSNGDVRYALNTLELFVKARRHHQPIEITIPALKPLLINKPVKFDKDGDYHYNLLSAFQKSIRGSDVDAALHYLARLIQGGDLQSIHRRLAVIAYEDIGLANPNATTRTMAAISASERIGLPEARIPLAHAVIDLCLSPKSNSAIISIDKALADLEKYANFEIPNTLKDSHYQGAKKQGYGKDYKYPHDYPNGYVKQEYLPENLKNAHYYTPKYTGKYERALADYYEQLNS